MAINIDVWGAEGWTSTSLDQVYCFIPGPNLRCADCGIWIMHMGFTLQSPLRPRQPVWCCKCFDLCLTQVLKQIAGTFVYRLQPSVPVEIAPFWEENINWLKEGF